MATPAVLLEFPDDEWDLAEWKEEIASQRPGGAGAFSYGNSEDVITIEVPYNQLRSCIRQMFGYSIADTTGSGYRLSRPEVQVQHPIFPWLWADSLASQPWNPMGNEDFPTSPPGTYQAKLAAYSEYNSPPYTVNYKRTSISVRFKEVPYRIYSDDDSHWLSTTAEYKRFLGPVSVTPKNELISATGGVEGSALYYADTTAAVVGPPAIAPGPTTGPSGTEVKGSVYTTKQTVEISLLWKQVEESYLIDTSGDNYDLFPIPTRLLAYLGTVNKTEFCDRPAGTLLFDGIGLQRKQQPLPTDTEFGLWAYDVTLKFLYFNPPTPEDSAIITDPPASTPILRGWHRFPWKNNGFWYAATKGDATTRGTYGGQTQLKQMEFANMFRYWSEAAGAYE